MKVFAQNLRERAEGLDLSYAEVARRCGLTERRFGHYVTGTREPDLATLLRICSVLDTTPNSLLGVEPTDQKAEGEVARLCASIAAACRTLSVSNLRLANVLIDAMIVEQRAMKGGARRRGWTRPPRATGFNDRFGGRRAVSLIAASNRKNNRKAPSVQTQVREKNAA